MKVYNIHVLQYKCRVAYLKEVVTIFGNHAPKDIAPIFLKLKIVVFVSEWANIKVWLHHIRDSLRHLEV